MELDKYKQNLNVEMNTHVKWLLVLVNRNWLLWIHCQLVICKRQKLKWWVGLQCYLSTTIAFLDIGDNMDIDLDEIGMYQKTLPQNG